MPNPEVGREEVLSGSVTTERNISWVKKSGSWQRSEGVQSNVGHGKGLRGSKTTWVISKASGVQKKWVTLHSKDEKKWVTLHSKD